MTLEATAKRTVQKLQRAIVNGLEDVKAIDIRVYNTEHLSPLFERVVVASGNSNRQTKALAASVRDAVREAGFDKPRTEGEENGEWIIVDCGQAVVHVMQPAIRDYYHLEEIWGDKPVRVNRAKPAPTVAQRARASAPKAAPAAPAPAQAATADKAAKSAKPAKSAKSGPVGKAKAVPGKTTSTKTASAKTAASKTAASKTAASKSATPKAGTAKPRSGASPARKSAAGSAQPARKAAAAPAKASKPRAGATTRRP